MFEILDKQRGVAVPNRTLLFANRRGKFLRESHYSGPHPLRPFHGYPVSLNSLTATRRVPGTLWVVERGAISAGMAEYLQH
jgi:hypothetical protein